MVDALKPDTPAPLGRTRAKAQRREALLAAAAQLFAERGFNGVSMEDLGSAVGMSGPAVYRHFEGKHAVLAALLIGVSEELLEGGEAVAQRASNGELALRALVEFHVRFALGHPEVIRVHDRDLGSLTGDDRRSVRALQRRYVEIWVEALGRVHRGADPESLRVRAHATFGLLNSTPYGARQMSETMTRESARALLERMALAALTA